MFIDNLRKLTDEERKCAAARRQEFFRFFDAGPIQYAAGSPAKPYLGDLSPGCRTCVNGTWSCIYVTTSCTRRCFYCPQDRGAESTDRLPLTDGHFHFDSPVEYVRYLEAFPFEGIGFSGGEPFLVFDRLIDYIEEVRRAFGARHYIWAYTNGDLATEDNLKRLRDVGLDELRFDLSANRYDFGPVALAVRHIDTVTIEIPAIPEDLGIVKSALKDMQDLGVKFLNLHQLMATKHNFRAFADRNYSITNTASYRSHLPVVESEMAALELLKHALETGSRLGINYCSRHYKALFQAEAARKIYAPRCMGKTDTMTATGYIRNIEARGPEQRINRLRDSLSPQERARCHPVDGGEETGILLPAESISKFNSSDVFSGIKVNYYRPVLEAYTNQSPDDGKSVRFGAREVFIRKNRMFDMELGNRTAARFFQYLFVDSRNPVQAVDHVLRACNLEAARCPDVLSDLREFRDEFQDLEFRPEGIPPYD